MNRFKAFIAFLFLLVLLAATLFGLWIAVGRIAGGFGRLDPNVVAAIIAALTAVTGVLYNQRQARILAAVEAHRDKKIAVYNKYLDLVYFYQDQVKQGVDPVDREIAKEEEAWIRDLTRGILVWGGPSVVKAWLSFRAGASAGTGAAPLLAADGMMRAMRKDLGNSNWGLKGGDLVKLFLSDPSELDQMRQPKGTT